MGRGELERLAEERAAADRRYNDALTAVDDALPPLASGEQGVPEPAVGAGAVRARAAILPEAPAASRGWRGRLAGFIWRVVGPSLTRQQMLNEALGAHADAVERAVLDLSRSMREARDADRRHREELRAFESRLVQFLQQITPFVDTKLRVLEGAVEELRVTATAAQRMAGAAQRQLERGASPVAAGEAARPAMPATDARGSGSAADAASYVGFEDLYRGSPETIRARQTEDADRFAGASDVLDIGCGRGEFLDLLRERGITSRGIDLNPEMVDVCRARGLDAAHADAAGYLEGLPDGTLGGLIAAQVVEHLEPAYLLRVLRAAHAALRPGSTMVLETINVGCWVAFFESYIRDITHVRPLHPDTLRYLVLAAGFERAEVQFRSPVEPSGRLQRIPEEGLPPELLGVARLLNGNVDRLNERLFTFQDYAIIAVRGQ